MKYLLVLCAVLGLTFVDVDSKARAGCFGFAGDCFKECPIGTHPFSSNCGDVYAQKTCQNQEGEYLGKICDINRCDCDEPYFLDATKKSCLSIEDCEEIESGE